LNNFSVVLIDYLIFQERPLKIYIFPTMLRSDSVYGM